MNLSINSSYSNKRKNISDALSGFRYIPKTSGPFRTSLPTGTLGYEEPTEEQTKNMDLLRMGRTMNEGRGLKSGEPFLKGLGGTEANIPIPGDYSGFQEPASFDDGLAWDTPQKPVIKNISYGDQSGQYVEDMNNKELLVKSFRGTNTIRDDAMRGSNRSGFMWQIDHTIPISLGGADTNANRQLLSYGDNDKKTRAQAVPYTLYANKEISLKEAREMAMQWKEVDVTDLPQPNKIGFVSDTKGKTGIEIAREMKDRWRAPKKVGFKEVMAEIPDTMKNFGEGWMPDIAREFAKGTLSGLTFGFLPYETDDDVTRGSTTAGRVGQLLGSVGSFMIGGAVLGAGAKALVGSYRGVAALAAARAGYKGVKTAKAVKTAATAIKAAEALPSSLNKAPNIVRQLLTPERVKNMTKMGVTSAFVGQVNRFVENEFNTSVLSGQSYAKEYEDKIKNTFADVAMGVGVGALPYNKKGILIAASAPMAMSYWANPDDPMGALTDGVVFGVMHSMASYRQPGFKLFGKDTQTKAGEKILKAYDEAWSGTAYEFMREYPTSKLKQVEQKNVLKVLKGPVHNNIDKIQADAVENIWTRFLFGRDVLNKNPKLTLEKAQNFAKNINKKIDAIKDIPELKGWEKYSLSARRARAEKVRLADEKIAKDFGEGYQTRIRFNKEKLSETEITDLNAALAEITRVTVACRQLYKGGLSKKMRGLADADDILSFDVESRNKRFNELKALSNPNRITKLAENFDESMFKNTSSNEPVNPNSKFLTGDAPLTNVAGNKINSEANAEFMKKVDAGKASRNIILVSRKDLGPLMRLRNKLVPQMNEQAAKAGNGRNYEVYSNPENVLQAFGIEATAVKGKYKAVPLTGFVASEFRLNKGKQAINKDLVGDQKPLKYSKDPIAKGMSENNLDFLIVNLDSRYTAATAKSGNPFMPVNFNESNWLKSIKLSKQLDAQGVTNIVTSDIANVNSAKTFREVSNAISKMNKSIEKPASSFIEKPKATDTSISESVAVPKESMRVVLKMMEEPLSVQSPSGLQQSFSKYFGSNLTEKQALELFNKRNTITAEEGINFLNKLANKGNMHATEILKLQATNQYVNSGILEYSSTGNAILKMPIKGKIKTTEPAQSLEPPTPPVTPPVTSQVTPRTAVTAKEVVPTIEPISKPSSTTGGLVDRLMAANLENSRIGKVFGRSNTKMKSSPLGVSLNEYLIRAKAVAENFTPKSSRDYKGEKYSSSFNEPNIGNKAQKKAYEDWYSKNKEEITKEKARISKSNEKADREAISDAFNLLKQLKQLEPMSLSKQVPVGKKGKKVNPANILKETARPDLMNIVESMLKDRLNLPPEAVSRVMKKVENFKFIDEPFKAVRKDLSKKDPITGKTGFEDLAKAKEKVTDGIYKWIDQSKKSEPGSYDHSFGFTLENLLKTKFGENYRNIPKLKELIGKSMGVSKTASNMWKYFKIETNTKGELQPLDQPLDYLVALAKGDKTGKKISETIRKKALAENRETLSESDVSSKALTNENISSEDLVTGKLRIKNMVQEDNMVKGMAKGDEKFLPGLTSIVMGGVKPSGSDAIMVGAGDARMVFQKIVKNHNAELAKTQEKYGRKKPEKQLLTDKFLFEGKDRGYTGKYSNLSKAMKEKVNAKTESFFDDIYNEYKDKLSIRDTKKKQATIGKERIAILEKRLERAEKALADPLERSNWETEPFLKNAIKEIKTDIAMYKSKVRNIVKNNK